MSFPIHNNVRQSEILLRAVRGYAVVPVLVEYMAQGAVRGSDGSEMHNGLAACARRLDGGDARRILRAHLVRDEEGGCCGVGDEQRRRRAEEQSAARAQGGADGRVVEECQCMSTTA